MTRRLAVRVRRRGAAFASALALGGCATAQPGPPDDARAPLYIASSSATAPYLLIASQLASADRQGRAIIEVRANASGFAALCGPMPVIVAATRPIRRRELAACAEAGVATVAEIEIGLGATVLAQSADAAPLSLTLADLYHAAAERVPDEDCQLIPNAAERWSDIRPDLPDRPIRIYSSSTATSRHASTSADAVVAGARSLPCLAALERASPPDFVRATRVRRDGVWRDGGEDDGALAFALTRLPDAVGVLSRVHALHQDDLVILPVDGIAPTSASIGDGRYPLSRPLYLYTSARTLTTDPRVRPILMALRRTGAAGSLRVLTAMGLTPHPDGQRAKLIGTEDGVVTRLAVEGRHSGPAGAPGASADDLHP